MLQLVSCDSNSYSRCLQESIRYLKDSIGKTAEKVKEELEPTKHQTGILKFLKRGRKKGHQGAKGQSAQMVGHLL